MKETNDHSGMLLPAEVAAYLAGDPILNSDLSSEIEFRGGVLIEGSKDGALVSDRKRQFFMLSSTNEAYGRSLLQLIPKDVEIIQVCQEHLVAPAIERFGFTGQMPCKRVAYLGSEPIDYEPTLDIRPATPDLVPFISSYYKLHDEPDLTETVERGDLWCGYKDGDFVGFIGRHPEGTMGMLYIFEEHRRKGYGQELEMFLANHILSLGEMPRGDVWVDNEQSLKLQEKMGFTAAATLIYWLFHR